MKRNLYLSVCIAVLGGFALTYIAILCWGYIAAYSPILPWMLKHGLKGQSLRLIVFPIDFLTNVIMSLPLALVLIKLQPRRLFILLFAAVIPSFLWLYLPLLRNSGFSDLSVFVPGWLHALFALPTAVWVMKFFLKPGEPNKAPQATCEDARA